jgi:hypothetical protein
MCPIKVHLFKLVALLPNKQIGAAEIDWCECLESSPNWSENRLFEIKGTETMGKSLGSLYI